MPEEDPVPYQNARQEMSDDRTDMEPAQPTADLDLVLDALSLNHGHGYGRPFSSDQAREQLRQFLLGANPRLLEASQEALQPTSDSGRPGPEKSG